MYVLRLSKSTFIDDHREKKFSLKTMPKMCEGINRFGASGLPGFSTRFFSQKMAVIRPRPNEEWESQQQRRHFKPRSFFKDYLASFFSQIFWPRKPRKKRIFLCSSSPEIYVRTRNALLGRFFFFT
jgi:hypothetical protein